MTEWQMLVSVLNSVYFSRNFKTCGLFCFLSILLGGAPEAPIQSLEAQGYSTGVIDPELPADSEYPPPPLSRIRAIS